MRTYHHVALMAKDREFWLMPVTGTTQQTRPQRSEVQRFDSEELSRVPEYTYKKLISSEKRIRLLQLRSGNTYGSEIFCELIQADYQNSFHIPTRLDGGEGMLGGEEEEARSGKKYADAAKSSDKKELNGEEEMDPDLMAELEKVESKRIEYEALSWCWGPEPADYAVKIEENGKTYKKRVRRELALALKYLRLPHQTRTLWIDAICINQDDFEERNHQVQMMARVYTRAKEVCIWLGEDTDESKTAIDFIRQEIMELKNFDTICSDKRYTEKWQALMMLMQRDWFSRRWVVQEIALATKARLYCGPDSIPWKEFAVAVELFVEVETASHRLSEIMQKDEKFRHIPNWFEHVSELGASLLVQATGRVFRAQRTLMKDDPADISGDEDLKKTEGDSTQDKEQLKKKLLGAKPIDPLDRRSLLSLEYLVSTMFIFKATEPRDVVYSLLAIARDASPFAYRSGFKDRDGSSLTISLLDAFLEEKPFVVDYNRPYADVCRDFVEFCIHRKHKLDPVQALDILCRPWALDPHPGKSIRIHLNSKDSAGKKHRIFPERKDPWRMREATYSQVNNATPTSEHMQGKKAKLKWQINYTKNLVNDNRTMEEYVNDTIEGKWKENHSEWKIPAGWDNIKSKYFPGKRDKDGSRDTDADDNVESVAEKDDLHEKENRLLHLPSWVNRASKAPFTLYHHPGQSIYKTGRAAADPLVGHPQDGHRNYSAAQTRPMDLKFLKFKRRPQLGHYSLYVTGFELDEVDIVKDASQGGNIPKAWLDLAGWEVPYSVDPPDKFWRTLVGDRGRDNRNPPYYYARACKESVHKGGIASNSVNTSALIDHERNSIVAEYCRRVQSVIWGRRLFKTTRGTLGLAPDSVQKGDKVCILYGCTVPVILRMHKKMGKDMENEALEDRVEHLKALIQKWEQNCVRKASYAPKRKQYEEKRDGDEEEDETLKRQEDKGKGKGKALGLDEQQESPECYYDFIGESYVHGMMDGEALRKKFYMDIADRVFELR
ncbi:heterokaryon incompatibility protein-domain-containing protein [Hypoxylon argillaceum]|nr:heterokaryon incompatibility protein-domain-containing protein [Hypoxylon argillaceum]